MEKIMKDKKLLNRRQWLRPLTSYATNSSIRTNVTISNWVITKTKKRHAEIYAELSLTDCSRSVTFSFDATTKKEALEQLAMLNKMLEEIDLLKDALVEAIDKHTKSGVWK